MSNAIKIQELSKQYGKSRGIQNINLEIEKGTVYGFIGPNGAGKSTTIKCIMNLINKSEGMIYLNDELVTKKRTKIKEKIGYLPSEIHLYEDLTVKQMLDYSASFYQKDCSKKIEELVTKLEVDVTKKLDELSLGNLKKVGIILTLLHDPEIIIMDEATSGLDPLMQEVFFAILKEEKQKGKTIFFSSHILNEIKKICDKVAIIKEGKIVEVSDIAKLNASNMVKVVLESSKVEDIKNELKMTPTIQKENEIEFVYNEDINTLIQILAKYQISKIKVEELEIEDIFMHYYK